MRLMKLHVGLICVVSRPACYDLNPRIPSLWNNYWYHLVRYHCPYGLKNSRWNVIPKQRKDSCPALLDSRWTARSVYNARVLFMNTFLRSAQTSWISWSLMHFSTIRAASIFLYYVAERFLLPKADLRCATQVIWHRYVKVPGLPYLPKVNLWISRIRTLRYRAFITSKSYSERSSASAVQPFFFKLVWV